MPSVIRYGQFRLSPKMLPAAQLPADRAANLPVPELTLPAMLPFPERSSMLIKTSGSGRAEAVQVLQTVMMRFLTTLPAGKVTAAGLQNAVTHAKNMKNWLGLSGKYSCAPVVVKSIPGLCNAEVQLARYSNGKFTHLTVAGKDYVNVLPLLK